VLGSTVGSQLSRLPVMQCAGLVRGGTHAEPEELACNGAQWVSGLLLWLV
jgi:hypothetical protein